MQPKLRRTTTTTIVVLLLVLSTACSHVFNRPPSVGVIQKAIMERGASNFIVGRIPFESVEIQQIGNYNTQESYWPVKARVVTKAGEKAVLDYQIYKDDYGNWAARQAKK